MSRNYYFIKKKQKEYLDRIENDLISNCNDEPDQGEISPSMASGTGNVCSLVKTLTPLKTECLKSYDASSEENSELQACDIEAENAPHSNNETDDSPVSDVGINYDSGSETDNAELDCSKIDESCLSNNSDENNLRISLKEWAVKHNVTHSALNGLLVLLKPLHGNLPSDARTLLGTASKGRIEKFQEGEFCYFGVEVTLLSYLKNLKLDYLNSFPMNTNLELNFNIDGIPLFHSSSISFWPILCNIHDIDMMPLVVAIYCGAKKPEVQTYLERFVNEMSNLKFVIVKEKKFNISIRSFIADAPARAFLKQIKQHGAYHACDHCLTVGEYNRIARSVSYDACTQTLRDDDGFRSNSHPNHHIGKSPLELLPIDMIFSFPLDYMHLVLLGITRKLLNLWLSVIPYKLSNHSKETVNKNLSLCKKYLPLEFNRKPQDLKDSGKWKATECRTFLLYVGPLSMQSELSKERFHHFFILSIAIRILCSKDYSGDSCLVDYAQTLLQKFVADFRKNYKNASIVYNQVE